MPDPATDSLLPQPHTAPPRPELPRSGLDDLLARLRKVIEEAQVTPPPQGTSAIHLYLVPDEALATLFEQVGGTLHVYLHGVDEAMAEALAPPPAAPPGELDLTGDFWPG